MIARRTLIVLATWCHLADATTLPQLSLTQLYDGADVVAVVYVVMTEPNGGDPDRKCGMRYHSRVVTSVKGDEKVDTLIHFGPYIGHEVGKAYLVFLTTADRRFDPKSSTNSFIEGAEAQHEAMCHPNAPRYRETFMGLGTFEIGRPTAFSNTEAVMVPEQWIALPNHLDHAPVDEPPGGFPTPWWWLRVDDVVKLLTKYGRETPNQPLQPTRQTAPRG